MAADEQLRRTGIDLPGNARVIFSRITSDMFHQDIHLLAFETQHFGEHATQVSSVAIAADSPQKAERRKPFSQFSGTDVSCMPDLIAGFEIVQITIIPVRMGVAQNADLLHSPLFFCKSIRCLIKLAMSFSVPSMPSTVELTHRS